MNVKRTLELLEQAARSEQQEGKEKLKNIGIKVADETIESVVDGIPRDRGTLTAECPYSTEAAIEDVMTS